MSSNDSKKRGFSQPYADYDIEIPEAISFSPDIDAGNNMLRAAGTQMVHQIATYCPIGLQSLNDPRRSSHDHSGCFNGMIYRNAGIISVYSNQNTRRDVIQMLGIVDDSEMIATFPTNYDDSNATPFFAMVFDRFEYVDETIKVTTSQRLAHNSSGTDRLEFPATDIVGPIIDANGKEYFTHKDFVLEHGYLKWVSGGNSPDNGTVISLRYLYRPSWYCKRILKETRYAKHDSFIGGDYKNVRLPVQVHLQREYIFMQSDNDIRSLNTEQLNRNVSPSEGSFGVK
jgi:hypothetical protein